MLLITISLTFPLVNRNLRSGICAHRKDQDCSPRCQESIDGIREIAYTRPTRGSALEFSAILRYRVRVMTKGEKTRERIFEAAVDEFAKNGYEGARVARIADMAGVNKERIYANFGNKEQLFVEVWKRTYQLNIDEDRRFLAITEDTLPDMGRIILATYMKFHAQHPEFWKIFAWENILNGRHKDAIRGLKRPVYAHLESLYRIGQERGIYKQTVSFQTFMFVLIAISFSFASNKSTMSETLGLDFSRPEVEERYMNECFDLLGP